ncbi:MAG: hypothetical protein WD034_09085, partial [Parvibaculum sp.]
MRYLAGSRHCARREMHLNPKGGNGDKFAKQKTGAGAMRDRLPVLKICLAMVRSRRLELPRVLPHSDLNAARLP